MVDVVGISDISPDILPDVVDFLDFCILSIFLHSLPDGENDRV
jgi:hypothetical protein